MCSLLLQNFCLFIYVLRVMYMFTKIYSSTYLVTHVYTTLRKYMRRRMHI